MHKLQAVRSLRFRYILGLSAVALLVTASWLTVQRIIATQENYSHLVTVSGNQSTLASRIAHFAAQMSTAVSDDEFLISRSQLGIAVNQMVKSHSLLLNGDPELGLPKIMTPLLETIYFDPANGLDRAVERYVDHARTIYGMDYGTIHLTTASFVYLMNYGPFVLEHLLVSATEEYEAFSRKAIQEVERLEFGLWISAMLILVLEAFFIFRPLESRVEKAIGELQTKNDELYDAKKKVEIALRTKTDFLAHMSHELRTPLNSVIGFSDIMRREIMGSIPQRYKEYAEIINGSGSHLLDLINDILVVSKIEYQGLELTESSFDIDSIIDDASLMLSDFAAKKNVKILRNGRNTPLPMFRGDKVRFKQIILNLMNNAVKFSEGGEVTASAYLNGGALKIKIKDTGIGIAQENIEKIMEPFTQVRSSQNLAHEGTGLGLHLSKRLTELHDGTLQIISELGIGTTVSLTFPPERTIPLEQASFPLVQAS